MAGGIGVCFLLPAGVMFWWPIFACCMYFKQILAENECLRLGDSRTVVVLACGIFGFC